MLRLFASFLGALTVSLYANANSQEIVIIENVNVIPMTSEVVLKNQSVVVKNGNVEGARVIAADGKYLIPGLSDMHAHINPGDIGENELLSEKDKQAAQGVLDQMLQQYLDFGVTTLRKGRLEQMSW